jgi:glycosyltransferase involved in cell wall biosynthesis
MRIPVFFNARFVTRPASGVDRVAAELLREFCELGQQEHGPIPEVLGLALPSGGAFHPAGAINAERLVGLPMRRGKLPGQLWEQFELPWWNPEAWLISPCNLGPFVRRRQLVIIHDAQALLVPRSYSVAFRALYTAILPLLARRAAIVVTVSEASKRALERTNVAPPNTLHVIPNGADHIHRVKPDPGTLQRYGLASKGYILAIGSLAPHKNLKMLIHAAADRLPNAPELVIAGGADPAVFANADLRPGPGCRLLGRISDAELKTLYAHAIALAFPSLTEGFGLPPLEAMACGCPVVASTADAVKEVCGDAVIYAPPDDASAWRNAFQAIASSAELRTHLAYTGTQRAARFTWRRTAEQYLSLLAAAHNTTIGAP